MYSAYDRSSEGFFCAITSSVGTSNFDVISERPVTFPSNARRLGKALLQPMLNVYLQYLRPMMEINIAMNFSPYSLIYNSLFAIPPGISSEAVFNFFPLQSHL